MISKEISGLDYVHVDVFSARPFSGNSLVVFPDSRGLTGRQMLAITQELRHFEAIFLEPTEAVNTVKARVFDLFEELPFAGHPIIGAAAVLHRRNDSSTQAEWFFDLSEKSVSVVTHSRGEGCFGVLDQGEPTFLGVISDREPAAAAFGLSLADLDLSLPIEVVSTGLRYLIVPVNPGALARAAIRKDISAFVQSCGAQFAVLLDDAGAEIRHWNNDGIIEDVATGSAAGTIGAYRLKHGRVRSGEEFILLQGRFTGRPSVLRVTPSGAQGAIKRVCVGGDVAFVGAGRLFAVPD